MYHYLMSFPYRIFAHFVSSQYAQVIFLRLINVAIVLVALFIFQKVLLFSGKTSKAVVNGLFLFFILTPMVPLLAAQINYDSLLLLATGLALLFTLQFERSLSTKEKIDVPLFSKLFVTCLLGSLVKYTFLPIFLAIIMYVGFRLYKESNSSIKQCVRRFVQSYRTLTLPIKLVVTLTLVISFGLCFERYGLNVIHYETPEPQCNQVLSVQECSAYAPWYRNYTLTMNNHAPQGSRIAKLNAFRSIWTHTMLNTLFYVTGPFDSTAAPMYLPVLAEDLAFIGGLVLLIRFCDKLYRLDTSTRFFILVCTVYTGILFAQNLQDFLHIGTPVGIQGRYLLPVLPLLYVLIATMASMALRNFRRTKLVIFIVLFACLLEGGGAMAFVIRSNKDWYWQNPITINSNQDAQKILNHVVIQKL
jgi:hypothetical protein